MTYLGLVFDLFETGFAQSSALFFGHYYAASPQHRRAVDGADCGRAGNLSLLCTTSDLKHRFGDVPHAVEPSFAQAATEGVDRQLTFQSDAPILNKGVRFALRAKAGGFEPVECGGAEAVVQLDRKSVV